MFFYLLFILLNFNSICCDLWVTREWTPLGGNEYYFGSDLVNYTEAKKRCSSRNEEAQLVIIYNQTIQDALQEIIEKLSSILCKIYIFDDVFLQ